MFLEMKLSQQDTMPPSTQTLKIWQNEQLYNGQHLRSKTVFARFKAPVKTRG